MPCFVPGKTVKVHLQCWFVVVKHTLTCTNVSQFHGYTMLRFSEFDTYLEFGRDKHMVIDSLRV